MSQGNLYILSAPSGAGKSSLISALLEKNQGTKKNWCLFHTRHVHLDQAKVMECIIILFQ